MVARKTDWPRYLSLNTGMAVVVFGIAVLIAWHVHFIPLIQVSAGQPPLTRQAALCYLLIGAALFFLAAGLPRAASVGAALALLLTTAIGLEYILDRDLGFDNLLGSGYIFEDASRPGRISPISVLCYWLASVALLAMAIPKLHRYAAAIAGIVASVLIAVGSVLFIVYRLAHMPTYGWGHFRHMSPQAAVILVVLGFGILFLALEESRFRERPPLWMPLAIGAGLLVATLGIWQALLTHVESQLPLLSHIMLAGGIMSALLVGIAVHLAQQASMRSHKLREGMEAFERLFNASADALLVADREGMIISANQRVYELFGYTPGEILGNAAQNLVRFDINELRQSNPDSYLGLPRIRPMGEKTELFGRRKDGSKFPVEVALSPLREGAKLKVLVAVRDISARKQLEEDLEASRVQAIASARLSALGMMAGGIAHEINNPLGIIHAMASDLMEMADEGSVTPQAIARKSEVIRETSERIAEIVKSLRHISREGVGDPLLPTPVAKIVAETLEICRAKFKANGVNLVLPGDIPDVSIPCREVQIAQVLLNLLQNAFDAVVEKKGERWVRLEVTNDHDSVALSVIDNGPGIPLEHRSRVGEPFFTTKPVGKGTGLGLSLSKTIAEDHGGSLRYSEDNGYTRFSLVLPLGRKAEAT